MNIFALRKIFGLSKDLYNVKKCYPTESFIIIMYPPDYLHSFDVFFIISLL